MIRQLLFSTLIFHCSFLIARAQSPVISYAHSVIDTLTSPAMDGRGYVDSADFNAATFIQHEFQKLKLLSFTTDYFQPFYLDVNVFPGKMNLKLNGQKLIPGKDFLINASSPSLKGKMPAHFVDYTSVDTSLNAAEFLFSAIKKCDDRRGALVLNRNQFTKKQFSLITDSLADADFLNARALLILDTSKLTWDGSSAQVKISQFIIRKPAGIKEKSTLKVNAQAVLKKNYLTRNVIGYIKGSLQPDSFIVFTAHYDHLGQMGDGIYFPGANDNASGISMVLNLADYFTANPPGYSISFICFSGEELGLLGSGYYVEHPLFPLGTIKFLVNLDIVGTGGDGIKVVNATEFPKQFDELLEINAEKKYMKLISPRGKAANSDHYPFYLRDIPCFFIYTMGGISAYHDVNDRAETLPLTKYEELFRLLVEFEMSVEEW
ncbi:MAG: M28 family peptidase [Chitinophagales bacterium]